MGKRRKEDSSLILLFVKERVGRVLQRIVRGFYDLLGGLGGWMEVWGASGEQSRGRVFLFEYFSFGKSKLKILFEKCVSGVLF
jgi:hypothetical protein